MIFFATFFFSSLLQLTKKQLYWSPSSVNDSYIEDKVFMLIKLVESNQELFLKDTK